MDEIYSYVHTAKDAMKESFKFGMVVFTAAVLCLALTSSMPVHAAESEGDRPTAAGKYPAFGMTQDKAVLAQGKKVYTTYCIGCHGVEGDGQGPSAAFLDPKPRNFKRAEFRFSSRLSGDLPTDEDLFRTITEGLHGTSMPAWPLLPETDRRAVISYIKTFASETWKNASPSVPTAITEDPYYGQDKTEAIRRGETVYHGMAQCYSCHSGYISPEKINEARAAFGMGSQEGYREDLRLSRMITNEDGTTIRPPDFTWDKLKRGSDPNTLYHVIGNGLSGVAMPTWKGVFPEEDLWSLVYYVQSLETQRPQRVTDEDLRVRKQMFEDFKNDIVKYNEKMQAEATKVAQAPAAPEVRS